MFYNSTLWLSEIYCTVQTISCRLIFHKRTKLGHNLQCYMFIHPPGVDSLSSLPSLFPAQLLGHCVEDHLQKLKRDIYQISWYHSKETYLFIICQSFWSFNNSPPPPLQPTGKCPKYIKHWSFKSKAFDGHTKTTLQESGINYKHQWNKETIKTVNGMSKRETKIILEARNI